MKYFGTVRRAWLSKYFMVQIRVGSRPAITLRTVGSVGIRDLLLRLPAAASRTMYITALARAHRGGSLESILSLKFIHLASSLHKHLLLAFFETASYEEELEKMERSVQ